MIWSAVVPLKAPGQRKSRLAERLSVEERDVLAERVAGHVGLCVSGEPRISRIIQLSVARSGGWRYKWRRDEGRGLNAELNALRANSPTHGLLVIHGDLPVLRSADIAAMLDAAEANDIALAPDRHERGTNAIALSAEACFRFSFGENSLNRHIEEARGGAQMVRRRGLALDLDTPDDFDTALADVESCKVLAGHRL